MKTPKLRPEGSGKSRTPGRQGVSRDEASGARIEQALGDRGIPWLVEQSGLKDSTVRDAIRLGPARADVAVKIAKALGVDLEWMLTGETKSADRLVEMRKALSASETELLRLFAMLSVREQGAMLASMRLLAGEAKELPWRPTVHGTRVEYRGEKDDGRD